MSEPVFDEDIVNLGYLKKIIENTEKEIGKDVSKNYATKPKPPYKAGDTWINGSIVYTCIKSREIGLYNESDWVTESGAKKEAETKSKTFLEQPTNYNVGDTWILQNDTDHKSGKKGEMLTAVIGREKYDENDWINMLDYGNITSINELAENINNAVNTLELNKQSGILKIIYSNEIPSEINTNDLWYITGIVDNYEIGKLYKYNGTEYELIEDEDITSIFAEANETVLTEDGKINIFYSNKETIAGMAVGDLCNEDDILYRYNGTKWVSVYNTKVTDIIKELKTVTERTVSINTDLGEIKQNVAETKTTTNELTGNVESISKEISSIKQNQEKWVADFQKIGGNNLFCYNLGLWNEYSGIEEFTNTEIKTNSVSGKGYLVGSGSSKQSIEVPNGIYTISFKYKKLNSIADTFIKINDEKYNLDEEIWTEFKQTIEVTTNHIELETSSDTNESVYIIDLLCNTGAEKDIWTQNPNEIQTDTVTIGKGIKVESSEKNTYTTIDADGNRTFNKATGERVAEMTDKGVYAKEFECEGQAQIAGLLVKQVSNQTWISSLL